MAKMIWPKMAAGKPEAREEPKDDDELEDGHDEQVRKQGRERHLPEVPGEHGKRRELCRKRDSQIHRDGIRQTAARSQARKTGAKKMRPAVARYESSKLMWKSSSGFLSSIKRPVKSRM